MNKFFLLLIVVSAAIINSSCTYKKIYNSPTIKQIPLKEYISEIKENDDILIIDVRTPSEYKKSHYPNAINVNLLKSFKKDTENMDTSKTVFIYCETAHRSPYAAKFLKQNGFTKIYDLEKGYSQIKKYSKALNND